MKVDIWSWKDPELQPMQKVQADEDKKRSYQAVIHLKEKKLVPLAGPDHAGDHPLRGRQARRSARRTSPTASSSPGTRATATSIWSISPTGSRKKILEKLPERRRPSRRGGQYLLYYVDQDRNWYSYRILDGKTFNLTAKLGVHFENEEHDTPDDPGPTASPAGPRATSPSCSTTATTSGKSSPTAPAAERRPTASAGRTPWSFRYVRLDRDERTVPTKAPVLLMATDEKTKASGYYRVSLAPPAADPAKVVMLDKRFGALQKAKNAEIYVFTLSRFEEFPNLWVSGPDLTDMKKLSDANPQQAEYVWGKSELIHYLNDDGVMLEAPS